MISAEAAPAYNSFLHRLCLEAGFRPRVVQEAVRVLVESTARAYGVSGELTVVAGEPVLENDPSLLSDYAEVRVRASRGKFDSKTDELLKQALKLNPDEAQALFLAGVAAEERRDFAAAITHWQRLLPQLEPGSEEARSLKASIAELQTMVESSKKAK